MNMTIKSTHVFSIYLNPIFIVLCKLFVTIEKTISPRLKLLYLCSFSMLRYFPITLITFSSFSLSTISPIFYNICPPSFPPIFTLMIGIHPGPSFTRLNLSVRPVSLVACNIPSWLNYEVNPHIMYFQTWIV